MRANTVSQAGIRPTSSRGRLLDGCLALTKPRVTGLSVLSAAAGFRLAADGPLDLRRFLGTVICTFLAAAGAGALNQYLERDRDALMRRTSSRPLPTGLIPPGPVLAIGAALALTGTVGMTLWVTPVAGLLTILSLLLYLFAYTPLKRKAALSTWVGAIPGALPPLIGWAACGGAMGMSAWSLYAVLYFWQIPHFLAIAWIRRDDYLRAGLPVLTAADPTGRRTNRQVLLHTGLLLAASLAPFWTGLTGPRYLAAAAVLGLGFAAAAALFRPSTAEIRARLLLKAGVVYLPCLLLAMVLDRV
jgi:protoheme IX farnesyltransferase